MHRTLGWSIAYAKAQARSLPHTARPPLVPWLADRNAGGAWNLDEKSHGLLSTRGKSSPAMAGMSALRGTRSTCALNAERRLPHGAKRS